MRREYRVGQRWRYVAGAGDENATLVVGWIEQNPQGWVIHVSIEGARTPIAHMPFRPEALDVSVTHLLDERASVAAQFPSGYEQWRQASGGVFTIPVAEAVAIVTRVMGPDFDSLVREMRAKRSDDLIDALYAQLFQLPAWFFLGDPQEPRRPVLWRFPQGLNPNPCLLGFTDQVKAESCVRETNLLDARGAPIVMPGPVRESIRWMLELRQEGVDWVCFNYVSTSENFPLYFDMAEQMLGQMR
jgi:hypothetical protein